MDTREKLLISLRGLRLHEYDWDGIGGLPLRGDVSDEFYDLFSGDVINDDLYDLLPPPIVTLNGNGTLEVVFGWPDDTELVLSFQSKGVVTYVKVFADAQTSVEGVIRLDLSNPDDEPTGELLALLEWTVQE